MRAWRRRSQAICASAGRRPSLRAILTPSTPQLFRGREGVRAYFAGLSPDVVLEAFEEPALERLAPGLFATAGFWRFRFGAEPRLYRLTWTVANRGGAWLIAQHHAARCDL